MTNPVGRPPGSTKVAGSGRKVGSLDKGERAIVTGQMAADILKVYQKLGGFKFLLTWAEENKTEFIRQGLSRLFPSPAKDDPDIQINQQFNSGLSELEAARRVAFALAKAAYTLEDEEPAIEADITSQWRAPSDAPGVIPEYEDRPLFQPDPPVTRTLENYAGGAGEQGSAPRRSDAPTSGKRTVNEIRRDQLRARRDRLL